MGQTKVQNDDAILFGSAKVELGLYTQGLAGLMDMGALNDTEFAFPPTQEIVEFDNTEEWRRYTNADKATISATMFEAHGQNIATLLAGMSKKTVIPGNPVAVEDETHVLSGTNAVRLENKNGAGTEVSSIVVTDSTTPDPVEAVRNTDYVVSVDSAGYTTIARVSGSLVIADGETVTVSYSYTPNSAIQVDVGGITDQEYLICRLTNTRPSDDKIYQITCWKVALTGDLKWTYAADKDLKPFGVPFQLEAIKDQTRPNKEQLFRIYDEQSQTGA